MTFKSYAQNFEDVLLNRVFGDEKAGTYIDVGAADPELDSVTKAFYDRGWTGINIDPLPASFDRLVQERSRDVNLQVAVGSAEGQTTFHIVDAYPELSTTVAVIAAQYADTGRVLNELEVPVRTLASICAEHVSGPVHFLKIDVEGAEAEVLRGADFTLVRPWIVLVESVTFGSSTGETPDWDSILRDAHYTFAYFDGLNRFYVAAEHATRLISFFALPVNVRDDFTVATEDRANLAVSKIVHLLGLDSTAGTHEILERATVLISDRISFENEALDASSRLRDIQVELRATSDELDAMNQQSFERERHIAWLAMERSQLRAAVRQQEVTHAAEAERRSLDFDEIVRQRDEAVIRVHSLQTSASWRIALPLRAARHPASYLRKMLNR
ncbi:FkbM family methyltransferase [Cryobacterium sp. M15]|uniref:FkbM family methyltransferase n=1 Tax=Cryobacterium sp. M15 TaxID=2048291 RepID=UPI000CE44BDD|nr:FkbM family methyltransferase [Cryobacterium sp. M15]